MMSRAVLAAVMEINAVAMRVRLARVLGRKDAQTLRAARAVIGDDHPLAQDVDYFLLICGADLDAVPVQAVRLRDCVLAALAPKQGAQIYV